MPKKEKNPGGKHRDPFDRTRGRKEKPDPEILGIKMSRLTRRFQEDQKPQKEK